MRRSQRIQHLTIIFTMLLGCLIAGRPMVLADDSSAPSLVISQIKITSSNGQFITLYNASATALDMSKFQLQYFNHYDLSKATSSRTISLSGVVPSHGYYIINDSTLQLCYQQTVNSASLGFSSTAGMIEVLTMNQATVGGSVSPVLQDYIGWSKTVTTGAQTLPTSTAAFLKRQPLDSQNNPSVSLPGAGNWQMVQPDTSNPCVLAAVNISGTITGSVLPSSSSLLLPAIEPTATTVIADEETSSSVTPSFPSSNIGLMSPKMTEILPNPMGTGNDSEDEYIELYNPNAKSFDLSGFKLRVGSTTFHTYTFLNGTSLPGLSFTAYFSSDTGLSLSNTSGRAVLLGPDESELTSTDPYQKAVDGQSWALANGSWQWSTRPTPNAANIVVKPPAKKTKTKAKPQASKSKTTPKPGAKTSKKLATSNNASFNEEPQKTPIHTGVLALVAVGALLYGAYEYRADLGNRIYQLRRYLRTRRANW